MDIEFHSFHWKHLLYTVVQVVGTTIDSAIALLSIGFVTTYITEWLHSQTTSRIGHNTHSLEVYANHLRDVACRRIPPPNVFYNVEGDMLEVFLKDVPYFDRGRSNEYIDIFEDEKGNIVALNIRKIKRKLIK